MTPHHDSSALPPAWRPWRTILVCVSVGPLVGLVALSVSLAIISSFDAGWTTGANFLVFIIHPFAWLVALVMGSVPAAIGAAIYVAIDRFAPRPIPRIPVAAAVGGAMAVLIPMVNAAQRGAMYFGITFAVIGAASGMVCAALTRRWRYVPPAAAALLVESPPASSPS
jgi:hypothetical protein